MPKEIWKDIKEYEGLYQISNKGRVKSLSRKRYNNKGFWYTKERIIKPGVNTSGYLYVILCKNSKHTSYMIHRLVANHFIKNNNKKFEVNHLDGNKKNNNINNLQWVSHQYNMKHASKAKLMLSGEKCWKSKFTIKQIKEIRRKYSVNDNYNELGRKYGVSDTCIGGIIKNKSWKYV